MKTVCILWWEDESGEWDFVGAYSNYELAEVAKEEELAFDPDCEYHITLLALKESK